MAGDDRRSADTATLGIDGAIRGDERLSATVKRHLIAIIRELRGAA
jgi:hypothetical protein